MKVYLAQLAVDYEGIHSVEVFATREAAEAYIKATPAGRGCYWEEVEEAEVRS